MSDEGRTAADDVLSSVADELYGGSPADFTARRGARADQIKRDGDPELAATVRSWRKPSVGAWLVNQLARARPGDLDRLVDLGEELRAAQTAKDGDRLRALAKQRLETLRDLDAAAADLARAAGQAMSDAIQRQVQSTLQAALADPQAADAVRAGHLASALEVTGFGSVDLSDAVAVPIKALKPRTTSTASSPSPAALTRTAASAARAVAKERLAAARAEAADATAEAGRARARWKDSESALAAARSHLATQQARVVERERALEQARVEVEAADEAARRAQAERDARERELQEARARREAADAAVRTLHAGGA